MKNVYICPCVQYVINFNTTLRHKTLAKTVKIGMFTGIYTLQVTTPILGNTLCFTRPYQNTLYRSGWTG